MNMLQEKVNVSNISHYYGPFQPSMGEDPLPLEIPLHIDKLDSMPCVLKIVLKPLNHNPNVQDTYN